jgi:hypothetical protein
VSVTRAHHRKKLAHHRKKLAHHKKKILILSSVRVTAPSLKATGSTVLATAGTFFTGPVASFTGTDASGIAGLAATITWGDSTTSPGTIAPDPTQPGTFDVGGSHTYAQGGLYPTRVTITGTGGATASGDALVAFPPAGQVAAQGLGVAASPGAAFTGTVATFTAPAGKATDYSATIAWGDGSTTPGSIVPDPANPGTFDVNGSHTYAQIGSFPVTVSIQGPGGSTATAHSLVTSTIPGPLTAEGVDVAALAGMGFTGLVATFTDPGGPTAGYTASILWGDGHTSAGSIAPEAASSGVFDVSGTNTYAQSGSFPVTVTIQAPGGDSATAHAPATVVNPGALAAQGSDVAASAGTAFTGQVATFVAPGGQGTDYTATIAWGDGHTSSGSIQPDPKTNGVFDVSGSNTYSQTGSYPVSVTIQGPGASSTTAQGQALGVNADSPTAQGVNVAAGAGEIFTTTVATFTAPGGQATAYTASISWGDGSTSPGSVAPDPMFQGVFDVHGSHTYTQGGTFPVAVTTQGGGQSATASSTATVATPVTAASGVNSTPLAGQPFTGVVAVLTAASDQATGYTASITWGDGNTSPGTITPDSFGALDTFDVSGTNTYAQAGTFPVSVTIQGPDGSTRTANSQATVTAALEFDALQSYVAQTLSSVQDGLNQQVFANPLPVVGTNLRYGQATQVIDTFRSALVGAFAQTSQQSFQQAVVSALGPSGLNTLQDLNHDGSIDPGDVIVTDSGTLESFEIQIQGHTESAVNFDAGVPGLPLQLDDSGSVVVDVGYSWDVTFGVSDVNNPSRTLFLSSNAPLTLTVSADNPDMDAFGTMGFFQVEATSDDVYSSDLSATFNVNVAADTSGHVTLATSVTGTATVSMTLRATIGSSGNLGLQLICHPYASWTFNQADPRNLGAPSVVEIDNVQLDLRAFMGNFIQPLISRVQSVTEQLQPVIDFLEKPIPIISDLSAKSGFGPLTFAGILESQGVNVSPFVDAINGINGLTIDQVSGSISVGSFDISDPTNITTTEAADVLGQITTATGDIDTLTHMLHFDFPVLDNPTQFVGLLLGQDVTFFTWTPPPLQVDTSYSQDFYPVADLPIVKVTVTGSRQFDASASFGYDSAGLKSGNLWDGFYVKEGQEDSAGNPIIAQLKPSLEAKIGPALDKDQDLNVGGYELSLSKVLDLTGLSLEEALIPQLDAETTLSAEINIALKNANNSGVVRATQLDPNDPLTVSLGPKGAEFSLGYDASIHIPSFSFGIHTGGFFDNLLSVSLGPVDLGPGHVNLGTYELYPEFKQLS